MRLLGLFIAIVLLSGFFVGLNSCKKETACVASIQCLDSSGNVADNAYVMLYALVRSADGKKFDTADVRTNGTTDSDGRVKFTFKYPATFDISATKYFTKMKINGLATIKLEEGQTIEKTVNLIRK